MDQHTQIYYGGEEDPQLMGNGDFAPGAEFYEEPYGEPFEEYGQEDMEDGFSDHEFDDDDPAYHEDGGNHRFRVAMNVFDTTSILIGVVVILALTALITSMVSWLRADIIHSFGMLQSGIQ